LAEIVIKDKTRTRRWDQLPELVRRLPELAYIVEIERDRVKVGDADAFAASSLRVTSIFRREDGEWRLVHRHADPITAPRPIESVLER
jgi:ketosteroid isomerase-like protein